MTTRSPRSRLATDSRKYRKLLTTLVLPLIGAGGLIAAAVLIVRNYQFLTGTETGLINQIPWLLVIAAVSGFGFALWLRTNRPQVYGQVAEETHETATLTSGTARPALPTRK
jgi:hypothetical protein